MGNTVTIAAERWCRGKGPTPNYADMRALLDAVAANLVRSGGAPFGIELEAWPTPDRRRFYARVTLESDPAAAPGLPLAAWFQWQHKEWKWSWIPLPAAAMEWDRALASRTALADASESPA